MLRYLRENSGNWIIKIFLGIIVVVFVFLGVGSMNSGRDNSVASVNDQSISVDEYQDAYRNLVEQMRNRFQENLTDDLLKALNVRQQALNTLIEQKLVSIQADKLKITVSDQQLQDSILRIEAFHRDGRFDLDEYRRVLGLNGMTPETFEQLQRNALRQQKVQEMVVSSVAVSDMEVQSFFEFHNTAMKVAYIKVDPDEFDDIEVTADQIQAHYDANPDRYQSEPKRKAVFIKFSPEDFKDQVAITPAQINTYYDQHPEEFTTPERVEASHILIRVDDTADDAAVETARKQADAVYQRAVVGGEDFAELAKETSQGPSRDDGGYLGIFDKNSMIQPFADTAFAMAPGDISGPVRTRFGWHVIKVTNRFDAEVKTLDQAAGEIETRLKEQEMHNMAYFMAEDAFDAVIDGDSLEQVAAITRKQVMTTNEFDRNGNGLDLAQATGFARAAFALEPQQISDIREIGTDYFLIQVVETIDPELLPLETVKDRIVEELQQELRLAAAETRAQALLAAAMASDSLETLAQEKDLTLSATDWFTRYDMIEGIGRSDGFNQAAFALTPEKPLCADVLKTDQGFFIIAFKDRQLPGEDDLQVNLADIRQQLLQAKQGQYFQAWINELKEQSRIEINTQFIN
jgi:peptidyl-prolyl cis-trans isomerase D